MAVLDRPMEERVSPRGVRDDSGGTRGASERPVGRRREDRIVGASRATARILEQASAAARTMLPVLIWGPSGAGREFIARAVHAWSERSEAPFVVVSCASLADALQGREIFGAERGVHPLLPDAHTGAFARAATGTVLLDGIEALAAPTRAALRGAIESGRYTTEGGRDAAPLRARVIVTAELPRVDLGWGEHAAHAIEVPPLAERREDVLPLAAHFLATASEAAGVRPVGFTPDARTYLLSEPWPGNVRELRARIREAVRLAGDGSISAESLLLASDEAELPSFKDAKRAFETRYVVGLLRRCGGNISRAARLARKDRKDFYDVIRRTGIDPTAFRG